MARMRTQVDLLTGQSIKGYKLLDRIGSGGFGAVYRAYQSTIGREVAVKVILPRFADHPNFVRRFEAEAQLVARLEHLHIVPLYDYWREPGRAYLVMRWMRGGSVQDTLEQNPFDLESAALLLDQICAALSVAHAHGVVHRDLKPSNILLDEEGNAYLADFGIAKDLRHADGDEASSGAILGSPDYLSPEQARGEQVTVQADLYSLGVTLYVLLTGQHPFQGVNVVERLYRHINEPLPIIETLDTGMQKEINEVIQRATAKDPQQRYESALALASAFRIAVRLDGTGGGVALAEQLTLREQEILRLIVNGQTNRQIAQALYVERVTVKWHIRQLYRKLDVRSRKQAVVRAHEMKLLELTTEAEAGEERATTSISGAVPAPVNPYKGLRPFESADRQHFFGREALVEKLLSKLALADRGVVGAGRFLAVVGPSGSGKSSLIKAGLVPALWNGALPGSERWYVVEMVPGSRPLDELEVALVRVAADQAGNLHEQLKRDKHGLLRTAELILPRDGSELVLVIDQFEELFALVEAEEERTFFLDSLVAAASDSRSRVRVVLCLRADFYDQPLLYPDFGQLVQANMQTLMPLTVKGLEQAIVKPAAEAGLAFEPGLVATIINDVQYQPGALPLLQYTLTELFDQRDSRTLTHHAYEAIGGVTAALARRADDLYLEQNKTGREMIRQLFLRLVFIDPKQKRLIDTRRRVPLSELMGLTDDEDLMDDVVDVFVAYRLLTLDHDPASRRPTVEVAHEALLREWQRLRLWIEDSRDEIHQQRRLQSLTEEWVASGRNPGLLLRETRLDQVEGWAAETDLGLTKEEGAFLQASLDARQDRRAEEEARLERELETAQRLVQTERQRAQEQTMAASRLRRRAVYLSLAMTLVVVLAIVATVLAFQARSQARLAQARELAAAALRNLTIDPELSILLAVRGAEITHDVDGTVLPEVEEALHLAILSSRVRYRVSSLGDVAFSADGRRLATSSAHGADVWDTTTGELKLSLTGHSAEVRLVEFGPTGRLFSNSFDNTVRIWDLDSGKTIRTLEVTEEIEELISLAVSADGRWVASSSRSGEVTIWDVTTGNVVVTLGHDDTTAGLDFSPDGSRLAVASYDATVAVWDTATWQQVGTLSGHGSEEDVIDVVFSPDGSRLASASSDGTARVWNAASGEQLSVMFHGAWVFGIDFSPDGTLIATGGTDGLAKVWEASTGRELLILAGHKAGIGNVAFSPDGRLLATGSSDGTARVWDISPIGSRHERTLAGHESLVFDVAYQPDGQALASASWDGTAKIWDLDSNRERLTLRGHTNQLARIRYSPDGQRLITASYDGTVKVWDTTSGESVFTIEPETGTVWGLAITSDGARVATGGKNGTIAIWDATTGAELHRQRGHEGEIFNLNYSPDGSRLASASWDGTAKVWDATSGALLLTLDEGGPGVNQAIFNLQGTHLATAGFDGQIRLWDAANGELVRAFAGHTDIVWDVDFDPDGSRLASGGFDRTLRIWDVANGEALLTLSVPASIPALAFSPDGSTVATGSEDATVRTYILFVDEVLALARQRVTRRLTDAECRRFLHITSCPRP